LDGNAVMTHLGIGPGPHIGEALAFLLEVRRREGDLEAAELKSRIDAWWADRA
jgi:poly(A) polymerase